MATGTLDAFDLKGVGVYLRDYDFPSDILKRIAISQLSQKDFLVLNEIVDGPKSFTIGDLCSSCTRSEFLDSIAKFQNMGLLKMEYDVVYVDVEARRYFEIQSKRFEVGFSPGIEYIKLLLKLVPKHTLLKWYSISKMTDNIVSSLVEKYFSSPVAFQNHLSHLSFAHDDPALDSIVSELLNSPNYSVSIDAIMEKFSLSREKLEEYALQLEFNFLGCLVYSFDGTKWHGKISVFREWEDYLVFMKQRAMPYIEGSCKVERLYNNFVPDVLTFLSISSAEEVFVRLDSGENWVFFDEVLPALEIFLQSIVGWEGVPVSYLSLVVQVLIDLDVIHITEGVIRLLPKAEEWLSDQCIESIGLNIYKLEISRYISQSISRDVCTERNVHEIEKYVGHLQGAGWVVVEEFLEKMTIPISLNSKMLLCRTAKGLWQYAPPKYTDEEVLFVRKMLYGMWKGGFLDIGVCGGKYCIRLTKVGRLMFGSPRSDKRDYHTLPTL